MRYDAQHRALPKKMNMLAAVIGLAPRSRSCCQSPKWTSEGASSRPGKNRASAAFSTCSAGARRFGLQSRAGDPRTGKSGPNDFAIYRIEDGGQHDRTPLFDRVYLARSSFPAGFMGCGKWFRPIVAAVEPSRLAVRRRGR